MFLPNVSPEHLSERSDLKADYNEITGNNPNTFRREHCQGITIIIRQQDVIFKSELFYQKNRESE